MRNWKSILTRTYIKKFFKWRFWVGIVQRLWFEKNNPGVPWLTQNVVKLLKENVRKTDVYLEFGSGQSTTWFASRVGKIYSVEHDKSWYSIVKNKVGKVSGLVYKLAQTKKDYLSIVDELKDKTVDICLVDGNWRRDCMLVAIPKIKIGGMLILDNAETKLPAYWDSLSMQTSWEARGGHERSKVAKIMKLLKNFVTVSTSEVSQDTIVWIRKA